MTGKDDGFTLIEVLVAMAISVLVIAAAYRGFAVGWRGLRLSEDEARALAVARAELASAGIETPLAVGTRSGVADGVTWSSTIRSYEGVDATPETAAYWVDVTARWRDRGSGARSIRLVTLKFGSPADARR